MIKFIIPFLLIIQLSAEDEAGYIEKHFPFFTSMLRTSEKHVSPRGLILKSDNQFYACFDTDKLCFSSIWQGEGVSMNAMAPGSYKSKSWFKKAPEGEKNVPHILGSKKFTFMTKNEGKWNGLHLTEQGAVIEYSLNGSAIKETLYSKDGNTLFRQLKISSGTEPLFLPLKKATIEQNSLKCGDFILTIHTKNPYSLTQKNGLTGISFKAGMDIDLTLVYSTGSHTADRVKKFPNINISSKAFWPEEIKTQVRRSIENHEFILEEIELPTGNSFKRKVRISGIAFFDDNRMALSTFDGDVWILKLNEMKWKRFASGFNEPQSLLIKNRQIYVFDRNGIIRLHDRDKNGEADFYENFCSLPIQTVESRDFAMDMVLHPDGSFILAKGGQRGQSISPHAGSVLKVSANGKTLEVLATNLREPYLGIDPEGGDIFVSDQQGNWVPTSPVYKVTKGDNYGFKADFQGKEPFKNIADPLVWIPYTMNQSTAGIFKYQEKQFIVLDYSRPGFGILLYDKEKPSQTSYRSVNLNFPFPLLKGAVNPIDGLAYLGGFKIWGSRGERISGLGRLIPRKVQALKQVLHFKEGVCLKFYNQVSNELLNPANYEIKRWNIERTYKYGSGHFKRDGSSGEESLGMSGITLSKDKKSLFLAIPDMQKTDQMKIDTPLGELAFTVTQLDSYKSVSKEFPKIDFSKAVLNLSRKQKQSSVENGLKTAEKFGCISCHATKEGEAGKPGPSWVKLFNSKRTLIDKREVKADASYLRESITDPAEKTVFGYQPLMPSYKGMISDSDLDSLILYIQSLK